MVGRCILFGVLVTALAACGSDVSGGVPASPASTTVPVPTTARDESPTTTSTVADLTVFIAAVDAALTDTPFAGAALTDPEVFIATGQLFCELLDGGAEPDAVLIEHLDAMESLSPGGVSDADATAVGAVLGVSLEVLCPHI